VGEQERAQDAVHDWKRRYEVDQHVVEMHGRKCEVQREQYHDGCCAGYEQAEEKKDDAVRRAVGSQRLSKVDCRARNRLLAVPEVEYGPDEQSCENNTFHEPENAHDQQIRFGHRSVDLRA